MDWPTKFIDPLQHERERTLQDERERRLSSPFSLEAIWKLALHLYARASAADTFVNLRKFAKEQDPAYFNSTENFSRRTGLALDAKRNVEFRNLHAKISATAAKMGTLSYGTRRQYYEGLGKVLGKDLGDLDELEAMRREHCEAEDSKHTIGRRLDVHDGWGNEIEKTPEKTPFVIETFEERADFGVRRGVRQPETGGYIETTPEIEWWFVVDPTEERLRSLVSAKVLDLSDWPIDAHVTVKGAGAQPRTAKPLSHFEDKDEYQELQDRLSRLGLSLTKADLVAVRLYTGVMGKHKWNHSLRKRCGMSYEWLDRAAELNRGNSYGASLHVLNQALIKMGMVSSMKTVWRGVRNGTLPDSFFSVGVGGDDEMAGGLEYCASGCSPREEVAKSWVKDCEAAVILEVRPGLCRPAPTGWLSDYAELEECTLPCFTYLQVTGSRVKGNLLYVDATPYYDGRRAWSVPTSNVAVQVDDHDVDGTRNAAMAEHDSAHVLF